MHVSYGAAIVGILGLAYGLAARRLTQGQAKIGAFVLLVAAVGLILVPLLMGVPW